MTDSDLPLKLCKGLANQVLLGWEPPPGYQDLESQSTMCLSPLRNVDAPMAMCETRIQLFMSKTKGLGREAKVWEASCVDSTAWQLQENHPSGESSSSLRKSTLTANHTSSLEKITLAALENLPCQQIILAVWKNHPGSLRKSPW